MSLCESCYFSRKPASETNESAGWIGCALRLRENHLAHHEDQIECAAQGEGWVRNCYLESTSGRLFNFQLLHQQVTKCPFYQTK